MHMAQSYVRSFITACTSEGKERREEIDKARGKSRTTVVEIRNDRMILGLD